MDNQIEILRFLIKSCERESMGVFNNLLKDIHLTANQVEVLTVLDSYGPKSVKDLGGLLICEKKSPSRLVQSLINKGLLIKETSKQDKRVSLIALSEQGKQLLPEIHRQNDEFNKIIGKRIKDKDQITELIKILSSYLAGTESMEKIQRRFKIQN